MGKFANANVRFATLAMTEVGGVRTEYRTPLSLSYFLSLRDFAKNRSVRCVSNSPALSCKSINKSSLKKPAMESLKVRLDDGLRHFYVIISLSIWQNG